MRLLRDELEHRIHYYNKAGYDTAKWMVFCRVMLSHGFNLDLYEAKSTVSKYVTVIRGKKNFKVRFSNHRPNFTRELTGDCDFFVGISNRTVTTTDDAIAATLRYFGIADDTRDSVILIEDN